MRTAFCLAIDVRSDVVSYAILEGVDTGDAHVPPPVGGIPASVFVGDDELFFGAEAVARGAVSPDRLITGYLSAPADAPLIVAGARFAPADLFAWTVDELRLRVIDEQGARPEATVVVVPGSWSESRVDAFAAALERDGNADIEFIDASEALAYRYSRRDPSDAAFTAMLCDADADAIAVTIVSVRPDGTSRRLGPPIAAALDRDDELGVSLAVDEIARVLADRGIDAAGLDAIALSGVNRNLARIDSALDAAFGGPIARDPEAGVATVRGAAGLLAFESAPLAILAPAGTVAAGPAATTAAAPRPRRWPWFAGAGVAAAVVVASAVVFVSAAAVTTSDGPESEPSPVLTAPGASNVTERSTPTPTSTPTDAAPQASPSPTASPSAEPRTAPRVGPTAPARQPAPAPAQPVAPVAPPAPAPPAAPDPAPVQPQPSAEPPVEQPDPSESPEPPVESPEPPVESPDPPAESPEPPAETPPADQG